MAKSSDIIKIGFDYRASLEQFEKETNGVFDGISEKAGKQRISIQLDAKNDKVIEKIKELQKLKLDKFTFEFGESGLAEQLKTFEQLEKKITEIINLSKGLGTTSSPIIDVNGSTAQIDKLQNKLDELSKKYDELSSKKIVSSISGKDIDLVDNEEFKRLSDEFSLLKDELTGLKREMQLFEEATVSADTFVTMEHSVNGLIVKVDDLIDKYVQLSVAQKNINPVETNISSPIKDTFQGESSDISSLESRLKEVLSYANNVKSVLKAIETQEEFSIDWLNSDFQDSGDYSKIEKVVELLKEYGYAVKNIKENDDDLATTGSIVALEDESKKLADVTENAEKASKGKDKFTKANKKVKESADSSSKAVSEEASEFNKIISKLDGYNTKLANFTVKPANGNRYPIYQKNIDDLTEKINKLQVLSEKDINLINTNDVEDAKALQKQIDELIFKMSKMSASEKGFDPLGADKALEKIHNELQKNSGMSKEAKRQIQSYYDEIRSGNPSKPIKDLLDDMYKLIQLEREAGRAHKSFKDIFKEKVVYGAAANMAGMIGIYDIINVGREGITVIRELDTALTEMRKVSDESISTLKEFQGISFDIADTIGTTAKQIQNSTADWMRLGYSISEASALAENSNIYKNVGDMEIDEATEHMVSSVQAWKSEFNDNVIETSEAVINRYNKIGNEFAISSADIGEAMETSAAALKAGGNSLNESLGLLTAGNIIQQDASTTSAALKILSLRIRGAKAELEEMGESTDGLADSSSKMREELKALTGVDIMLDEDTFKSTAQIIQEMGENWSKMTDVSQAAALEKIAGKNRASTVAGLIENYETIAEVIEAAENAEGSALAENEKYLDSIDGKMQQLENRAQEFWFKLIDSEAIKDGIDLLSSLVKGATDFVDAFGVLGTAGLGAGLFASFKGAGRVKIAYPHLYTYACRNKTLYA